MLKTHPAQAESACPYIPGVIGMGKRPLQGTGAARRAHGLVAEYRRLGARLRQTRPGPVIASSWTLGLVAGVAAWNVPLMGPGLGIDPSWQAGLYMAAHDGLHFGDQIIYTFGPLGFLQFPVLYYPDEALLAFLYQGLVHLGLAVALVWVLRRWLGALPAFLLTFLVLAWYGNLRAALVLALALCLGTLIFDDRAARPMPLLVGGALLSAFELLSSLKSGPAIFA